MANSRLVQGQRPAPCAQEGMCHGVLARCFESKHSPPCQNAGAQQSWDMPSGPCCQRSSAGRNQAWVTTGRDADFKINQLLQGHRQVTEVWQRQGQLSVQSRAVGCDAWWGVRSISSVLLKTPLPQDSTGQAARWPRSPPASPATRAILAHRAAAWSCHDGERGAGQGKGHHSYS